MLLTFDLDNCQLIQAPGFISPIKSAEAKRGDGEDIQLQLVRDGELFRAPGAAELVYCVKKWGDFSDSAPAHALAVDFVFVDELQRYEAMVNYNTELLTAMMLASGSAPNAAIVDLMLEVAYRPSSALTWRRSTNVIRLTLHNNVWRGNESVPGAETGTELLPSNYLTKDRVIEYLPICTGLLGGGVANLDGLATAGGVRAVNSAVAMIDNTGGLEIFRVYELVAANIAEDAPALIRPDDFHASANARVWRLRTARVNFDPDSYFLKTATVEWLSAVNGLTGGGSTKLDGLATVARPVKTVVALVESSSGSPILRHYELITGTTAESAPNTIRPDDYNSSTNAKVWTLRGGSGSGSEYLTPSNAISLIGTYDLEAVVTVGVAVGRIISKPGIAAYGGSEAALQFWRLTEGVNAGPASEGRVDDIVTPSDWHTSTNNKKWVRVYADGYGVQRPLSIKQEQQVPMLLPQVTALLGSGATLAAYPTAGRNYAYAPVVCVRITVSTVPTLYFYQLLFSAATTSSVPDRVLPNDWHATTNARCWHKLTIG